MKRLAIITARGGSERIPRKNIRLFMGKPMLAYAVRAAQESGLFSTVMVSTDDEEIAQTGRQCGADIPFMRSGETSNAYASTRAVLSEVLREYKRRGEEFEEFCCIYPCVPFLTGVILQEAHEKFIASGANQLIPVVRYAYPIQRALRVNTSGWLEYREPQNYSLRSQECEPMYHDVGMFYFYRTDTYFDAIPSCMQRCCMYELDERMSQDIDTPGDWERAELKYRILHEMQGDK